MVSPAKSPVAALRPILYDVGRRTPTATKHGFQSPLLSMSTITFSKGTKNNDSEQVKQVLYGTDNLYEIANKKLFNVELRKHNKS